MIIKVWWKGENEWYRGKIVRNSESEPIEEVGHL
jgi:hypothetical protein